MKKNYFILIAIILGLIVTTVILLRQETEAPSGEMSANRDPYQFDSQSLGPMGDQSELIFDGSVKKEDLIRDYEKWAQYPPDSRPLLPEHRDVVRHREIPVSLQTMPVMVNGKPKDSGYNCLLQPRTHSVTEGEQMHLYLACTNNTSLSPLAIKVTEIKLVGRAGVRRFNPEAIQGPFDDGSNGDANAGDNIYTFNYRPKNQDWGDIHATINFTVLEGDRRTDLSLSTHFFSSPESPAHFTGNFQEEYRDGSLYLSAEIEVKKPGSYTIMANLFGGDKPVAFAREDKKLEKGLQTVELQFFGKVIKDRAIDGPYTLKDLRGWLNTDVIQPEILARPPAEVQAFLRSIREDRPKRMLIPYTDARFKTENYMASEFPGDPYDSPQKRERLRLLSNLP